MVDLWVQWGTLAGAAALITLLVNILKFAGVVKDGDAQTWSAGLNLIGMAILLVTRVYRPDLDIGAVDVQIQEFTQVGLVIFGYVVQLLASKGTHMAIRNVPLIGKSFSAKQLTG